MFTRSFALVCAVLSGATVWGGEVNNLTVSDLAAGSRLEIATLDRVYRAEVVDPTSGETRMTVSSSQGPTAEPATVFLLGATQGRMAEAGGLMLVKMGQVHPGLRIELGVGSLDEHNRVLTEPVKSIRVD
jgi:hypothetical protein